MNKKMIYGILFGLALSVCFGAVVYPPEKSADFIRNLKVRNIVDSNGNDLATLKTVYDVRDYGATGNGTTNDRASISTAEALADDAGGTVFLPTGSYRVGSAFTFSSGVRVEMAPGAKFDLADGVIITFEDGPDQIKAGHLQKIFDVNDVNAVSFSKAGDVWVGWWLGREGDGVTDDANELLAAIGSLPNDGGVVHPYGHHVTSKAIGILDTNNVVIDGIDRNYTWIDSSGTDTNSLDATLPAPIHTIYGTIWVDRTAGTGHGFAMRNITIKPYPGGSGAGNCKVVMIGDMNEVLIENCTIYTQNNECVYGAPRTDGYTGNWIIRNNNFYGQGKAGVAINTNMNSTAVINLRVIDNYFYAVGYALMTTSRNNTFQGNTLYRCLGSGVYIGENTSNANEEAQNTIVSGNLFIEHAYGLSSGTTPSILVSNGDHGRVQISNNAIYDQQRDSGIMIHGSASVENNLIWGTLGEDPAIIVTDPDGNTREPNVYITSNTIGSPPGTHKWKYGVFYRDDAGNSANITMHLKSNTIDVNDDGTGYPVYAKDCGKIYLENETYSTGNLSLDGGLYDGNSTISISALKWNNKSIFTSNQGGASAVLPSGYIRLRQSEDALADNNTIVIYGEYLEITSNNGEGAPGDDPNITISEANAVDGQLLYISLHKDSPDEAVIKNISGQVETITGADVVMTKNRGVLMFMYCYDRWQQIGS
jgi:hypothetical protein